MSEQDEVVSYHQLAHVLGSVSRQELQAAIRSIVRFQDFAYEAWKEDESRTGFVRLRHDKEASALLVKAGWYTWHDVGQFVDCSRLWVTSMTKQRLKAPAPFFWQVYEGYTLDDVRKDPNVDVASLDRCLADVDLVGNESTTNGLAIWGHGSAMRGLPTIDGPPCFQFRRGSLALQAGLCLSYFRITGKRVLHEWIQTDTKTVMGDTVCLRFSERKLQFQLFDAPTFERGDYRDGVRICPVQLIPLMVR